MWWQDYCRPAGASKKLISAPPHRLAERPFRVIANRSGEAHLAAVKEKERVASPAPGQPWTRAEDYLGGLARMRSSRKARRERLRTEPERPLALLSTVPFYAVIGLLAVLAIAIMIVAFPGSQPQQKARQVAAREQGVAQRGWLQEAQKEMH